MAWALRKRKEEGISLLWTSIVNLVLDEKRTAPSDTERLRALRRQGGFFVLGPRTRVRVTGADRLRYLNGQLSNDLRRLVPGEAIPALLLTAKGKLCADVFVWIDGESLIVEAEAALGEALVTRLERYAVSDDVAFELLPPSAERCHFLARSPQGGRACEFAASVSRESIVPAPPNDLPEAETRRNRIAADRARHPALGTANFPRILFLRKLVSIGSQLISKKVATLARRSSRASIASDESIAIFADLSGTSSLRASRAAILVMPVADKVRSPHQRRCSIPNCKRRFRSASSTARRLSCRSPS